MADSITKCVAINGANGQVSRYQVTFSLDLSSISKPNVDFTTTIFASQLKNPTDLTAVKTLACQNAKNAKTRILAHSTETSSSVEITGPVSL